MSASVCYLLWEECNHLWLKLWPICQHLERLILTKWKIVVPSRFLWQKHSNILIWSLDLPFKSNSSASLDPPKDHDDCVWFVPITMWRKRCCHNWKLTNRWTQRLGLPRLSRCHSLRIVDMRSCISCISCMTSRTHPWDLNPKAFEFLLCSQTIHESIRKGLLPFLGPA